MIFSLPQSLFSFFFLLCLNSLSLSLSLKTTMTDPAPAAEAAVEAGILSRERRIPLRTLPMPKRACGVD
jgi:hypothetical protein